MRPSPIHVRSTGLPGPPRSLCPPADACVLPPGGRDAAAYAGFLERRGLVGMGGSGFPTAQKIRACRAVRTLVVNGVECEPGNAILGEPVLFSVCAGATLFTAAFIVSDPSSMPVSKGGRIAAGIIAGTANAGLRHFGYYTETIVYAVLFANLFTLWLDRLAFRLQGRRLLRRMP